MTASAQSPSRQTMSPAVRAQLWSADVQDGVITRTQAHRIGMTDDMIDWRVRRGIWQRLYPGVYATFSGDVGRASRLWAAVLRAGPGAVLSYDTAAELWQLTTRRRARIHVTVPRGSKVAPIRGVILHYSGRVREARHPVLKPARTSLEETVLDLAQSAARPEDALGWIFTSCGGRRTTPGRLAATMQLRSRMRWRREVAKALADAESGTHSVLEHRYRNGVERAHGLPRGTRQLVTRRRSHSEYADVAYEAFSTLVELDGRAAHPESTRWRDVRRDNANAADGRITLRYSWTEVTQNSCGVASEVGEVLRRRGWTGRLLRCGRDCQIASSP